MKIHIKVKEAVAHYNRVKKPKQKMTFTSLGKKVFGDDDKPTSDHTRQQYLSGWNNGYTNSKIPSLYHVVKIHLATGYSMDDLIHVED